MSVIKEHGLEPGRVASAQSPRSVRRAPSANVKSTGPKFFMPGEEGGAADTDRAYTALRAAVTAEVKLTCRQRRIYSIHTRMKGGDCTIEVGGTVPGHEGVVQAILDVGGDQPFYVQMTDGAPPLRLGKRVYSLVEFRH